VCIILNVLYAVFLLFSDTTRITRALIPSVLFFLFTFGNNAVKMVVSTATNALRMDIVDYELYRSGRFMPASVSATYSFVDKLVSSLGATIATGMVALIGYNQVAPQASDPLTTAVKVMTVVLLIGFPILGWICTILAMKKSELSREKMVEVQRVNKERQGQGVSEEYSEQLRDERYSETLKETVEDTVTPGENQ
jgi:Na+/melibiose symporter-like transporter